jgi:uncharacterized protein YjbI with pentapeptide repeats/outer membrane protein assembly factor BamB
MARISMRVVSIAAVLTLAGGALTTSSEFAFAQSVSCPTVDPSTGITTPAPGPGTDWSGCDLAGADFEGDTLTAADLAGANVTGTSFWKANLAGADLAGASAGNANLMQANLASTNLTAVDLSTATLAGTESGEITASHAPAALPQGWTFIDGYLVGPDADLDNADLAGANLSNDDFNDVQMNGANLSGTDLSGTELGAASLDAVRSGGITGTPASLPSYLALRNGFIFGEDVDLASADLAGLNLAELNISDATLTGANLTKANLDGANLAGSDITRARLAGARLSGVSFTQASLAGDNLAGLTISDSSLALTNLSRARMAGVTLTGDTLTGANFGGATMTGLRAAGSTGSPSVLPPNWSSFYGYLFGPGANLSGVNLKGDFLVNSDLAGANLSDADLSRADLASADLTGTRLNGADLADGTLSGAELTAANPFLAGVSWTGVTCPDGKTAGTHGCFPSAVHGPQLSINARVGGPGSTVQLSGGGYRRDEKLTIRVGASYRASVRTSRAGQVGPVSISVPASARPGLVAVTAAASARGQSASAWFTVQVSWTQQGFGPDMTGDNNAENVITPANAGTFRRVWAFGSTGGLNTAFTPAVDAGVAYAVNLSGQLTALSATTGRKLWSWTDPNAGSPFPRVEAPVTADGNLAFVADTNYLWAIGPGGYVAWKSSNLTPTSAPTVAGGELYIADSTEGYLYALNAASGLELWRAQPGTGGCTSQPAYSAGTVYASCGNTLYALSAATGTTEWSWTGSDGALTTPAISGSTVYVGDARGDSVYAISAKAGALLWTYSAASQVGAAPAVGQGIVFVTTEGGTLDAVNANTGARLWQFNLGASGPGATAPALAGAVVYAASSAGTIYALNAESGKKLWSLAYGEPVLSSPVVANGVLYLGNGSYGIDAFGVR